MHRVYNSAFMNMLRDEENANYRSVIKNTLEFDPEVLKRHVNFMNNPDERTAVDQFGKGDKYFGTCTLLATLPGLPMFGHGQIEGYAERYGMEYRRAYHDENPDSWLVARHEREITPLLHRRWLFAEVKEFLLYDFFTDEGRVNEDVYAYTNRVGNERGLVVYHNRFADTRGWIRVSCAYAEKTADGGKHLRQRTIGEALGLSQDDSMFIAYRDAITGLEYLGRASDVCEKGLRIELGAYKYQAFVDWRELQEVAGNLWGRLCDTLAGRGVSSLDDAMRILELTPVHNALRAILDRNLVDAIVKHVAAGADTEPSATVSSAKLTAPKTNSAKKAPAKAGTGKATAKKKTGSAESNGVPAFISESANRLRVLLQEARNCAAREGSSTAGPRASTKDIEQAIAVFEQHLTAALRVPAVERQFSTLWPAEALSVLPTTRDTAKQAACKWATVLAYCVLEALGNMADPAAPDHAAAVLFETLRLREPMAESFVGVGYSTEESWRAAARVRAAFAHPFWLSKPDPTDVKPAAHFRWLDDPDVAWLIGVHEYEGVRYFAKEPYERLLWWMSLRPMLAMMAEKEPSGAESVRVLEEALKKRELAAADAGYSVENLFESE